MTTNALRTSVQPFTVVYSIYWWEIYISVYLKHLQFIISNTETSFTIMHHIKFIGLF